MISATDTFTETLWIDEDPHLVLKHKAETTINFVFPQRVLERFGVRGIRVSVLDLICWLAEPAARSALALEEDQGVWLDELVTAERRATDVWDQYRTERCADSPNGACVTLLRSTDWKHSRQTNRIRS
jgi:hypothetical protein